MPPAVEIEASIRPHFGEQPEGVVPRPGLRINRPQFNDLDVVQQKLQLLFRRGGVKQVADVLPGRQKRTGIVCDTLNRSLLLRQVGQLPLDLFLFLFEPSQLHLHTGQASRAKAFQDFDQSANFGMNLGQTTASQIFGFAQSVGFATETLECFLHNAVSRFDHPADL